MRNVKTILKTIVNAIEIEEQNEKLIFEYLKEYNIIEKVLDDDVKYLLNEIENTGNPALACSQIIKNNANLFESLYSEVSPERLLKSDFLLNKETAEDLSIDLSSTLTEIIKTFLMQEAHSILQDAASSSNLS